MPPDLFDTVPVCRLGWRLSPARKRPYYGCWAVCLGADNAVIDYIDGITNEGAIDVTNEEPNRRRFTRILFDAPCKLSQGARVWSTRLIDISLQGLLVVRPADWTNAATDDAFGVAVYLADDQTAVNMTVSLKHAGDNHLGFVCRTIDLDSATHLRRLVELNLGDDAAMHRELEALISQHQSGEAGS